ncbi:rhodanese-like domain-containing protein [Staphylococcus borealis]|uniref:rhodanese-like domain-containing protein n=1 Tax=Staphylococcus borealis TaxID=2742203 RepID=UPI000D1DAD6A|nr:hypothetical protein BUZ28_03880 [Staphylococcus borealis]RIO71760.1 rhodanese-like domain-containing protein [Staphylococcus borealis]
MLEQASVFVHYLSPVENGELLLLDVRPTEEYESGYFPGAISMPIEELEDNVLDWRYVKGVEQNSF